MVSNKHITLVAGGTGGHMMPAEAAGRVLLSQGQAVHFITDQRGDAYPDILQGVPRTVLKSGHKSGVGFVGKARLAVNMFGSAIKCWRQFGRERPDLVVGFGGYPSIPALLAARARSVPAILHEQNAVFGRSNRMLASGAKKIALSFANTQRLSKADKVKTIETGNPVRRSVEQIGEHAYQAPSPHQDIRILVVGGSQGATILSRIVPKALSMMDADIRARLRVVHQGRASDIDAVRQAYESAGIKAEIASYFTDMDVRLAWSHLVIARAGASTVCELAAAARPSILVPLPSAMDDHQTFNARYLEEAGGAMLLAEENFTSEAVSEMLKKMFCGDISLEQMSLRARSVAKLGAAENLADLIIQTVGSSS